MGVGSSSAPQRNLAAREEGVANKLGRLAARDGVGGSEIAAGAGLRVAAGVAAHARDHRQRQRHPAHLALDTLTRTRTSPQAVYLGAGSFLWSGERGSNSQHSAWKADTLPIELSPQACGGGRPAAQRPQTANHMATLMATVYETTAPVSRLRDGRVGSRKRFRHGRGPGSRRVGWRGNNTEPPATSQRRYTTIPI